MTSRAWKRSSRRRRGKPNPKLIPIPIPNQTEHQGATMRHLAYVLTLTVLASTSLVHAQTMPSDFGPSPALPAPEKQLIPTLNVAPVQRWQGNTRPTVAAGFAISAYASGLDHPRWLYVLPNGDVLVAETNAPPKPEDAKGLRGAVMGMEMKRAG